jgi:tetratricopeptide (TPR) repeat protein
VGDIFLGRKNWADAMNDLRKYYLLNGNKYEALRVAKGLELQFPHDWNIPFEIAKSCLEVKQYSESLLYFKKAFVLAPNTIIAQGIVFNLLQLNKLEETKKYLQFMIQNDPANSLGSKMLMMINDVLMLKELLVSEPKNITTLNNLADFYLNINNPEEAKFYIDKALSVDAKNAQSLCLLGVYNKQIKN